MNIYDNGDDDGDIDDSKNVDNGDGNDDDNEYEDNGKAASDDHGHGFNENMTTNNDFDTINNYSDGRDQGRIIQWYSKRKLFNKVPMFTIKDHAP
jgi:hypothetical protein